MSENEEIHLLDHKVRLLQAAEGFKSCIDSVLLAAACSAGVGQKILDMGCGVGGASFCLLWRQPETHVTGVEIQNDHVELARRNIRLNDAIDKAEFVASDIRDFRSVERFDHVMCNPPYLEAGTYTPSPYEKKERALGHSTSEMQLQDWLDAGFHNLKSLGSFTIIHRADMVDKIVQGLGRRFGGIEIIPLWPREGQDAKRVIVRAFKDRKSPSRLHSGIILHEDNGDYTAMAQEILRKGHAIL